MNRLKHKKGVILVVIIVAMLGLVTGAVLLKKSQTEIPKAIDMDSKLDYQYLTADKWFQKLGKVQVYRQYEGTSENFKMQVEDRLEYRGSQYIKKGTNYHDPYFYMKSIVVTEYIGLKGKGSLSVMPILSMMQRLNLLFMLEKSSMLCIINNNRNTKILCYLLLKIYNYDII